MGNKNRKNGGSGDKVGVKKWVWGVFFGGLIVLMVGVGVLVANLLYQPGTRDAEFLVEVGKWKREGVEEVVWSFDEIGKGVLTTDGGEHEWEFSWEIDEGKLVMKTEWLYELLDEYEYEIDREGKVLRLGEVVMVGE